MSDETNDGNPLDDAPGWAAPNSPSRPSGPQDGQPPQMPQPQSLPPYEPPSPYQNQMQQGEPAQPYDPYGNQIPQNNPVYPTQKKKSKLWLWITLAIVIPLLLCGLGIGGCTVWFVNETKSATGVTNDFYAAAKAGKDTDPYSCAERVDDGVLTVYLDDSTTNNGKISNYNFTSYNNSNGVVIVSGTVTRRGIARSTEVEVVKEDGKHKVCNITEINSYEE